MLLTLFCGASRRSSRALTVQPVGIAIFTRCASSNECVEFVSVIVNVCVEFAGTAAGLLVAKYSLARMMSFVPSSEFAEPVAGSVRVALLPIASLIVPPFSDSEFVDDVVQRLAGARSVSVVSLSPTV